jgi:hypothetical protein
MNQTPTTCNEVTFGRRRPDSVVVDWTNKVLFLLEFKLTSDQRRDYRVRGYSQVRAQHDILIRSLEKVAGEAEGENGGWKIKLIIFGGGTSGSVNVQIFNDNLTELQVLESKRNAISKGLVYELPNTQDMVLCSYFAQRSGDLSDCQPLGSTSDKVFENVMSERKALVSHCSNGGKSNLPHAISVSWSSMQGRHQCAQAEE